ncbi:MAG: hypothetical protein WDO12_07170 [Pseudomonadota bacterium]
MFRPSSIHKKEDRNAYFLTKKHLSRRTFLRGTGVALGLPFLDAMVPAGTALSQTAAAPKTRAGFFYLPHGAIQNNTPFGKEVDADLHRQGR